MEKFRDTEHDQNETLIRHYRIWNSPCGKVAGSRCLTQGSTPCKDTGFVRGCGVAFVRPRDTAVQSWEGESGICINKSTKYNRTLIYIYIYIVHLFALFIRKFSQLATIFSRKSRYHWSSFFAGVSHFCQSAFLSKTGFGKHKCHSASI